jgi:hypothetical protein
MKSLDRRQVPYDKDGVLGERRRRQRQRGVRRASDCPIRVGDGGRRDVTRTIGHDGHAHFAEELAGELLGVTLLAARERVGPFRPADGTGVVIEA